MSRITPARRHNRGLHLRLDADQHSSVLRFALARRLTLTAAVRALVERGLVEQPDGMDSRGTDDVLTQLRIVGRFVTAGLIASEEARLAVESVLWSANDERLAGIRARAATAAGERLVELESAEGELL